MNKEAILKNVEAVKCRSAWNKGVKEYSYMLLDNIFLYSDYKAMAGCTSTGIISSGKTYSILCKV